MYVHILYYSIIFHGFSLSLGIIYSIDKICTLRTKYMKLDILETKLLPSEVIKIKFYRPPNMKVKNEILSFSYIHVL